MTENRYSRYLPDPVKELQEFQKLGQIEGLILQETAAAKHGKYISEPVCHTADHETFSLPSNRKSRESA